MDWTQTVQSSQISHLNARQRMQTDRTSATKPTSSTDAVRGVCKDFEVNARHCTEVVGVIKVILARRSRCRVLLITL